MVEILSPSNTTLDLALLRKECFEEGTRQFWEVNMDLGTVTVYKPGLDVAIYDPSRTDIPLDELIPGAVIPVNAIFTR